MKANGERRRFARQVALARMPGHAARHLHMALAAGRAGTLPLARRLPGLRGLEVYYPLPGMGLGVLVTSLRGLIG